MPACPASRERLVDSFSFLHFLFVHNALRTSSRGIQATLTNNDMGGNMRYEVSAPISQVTENMTPPRTSWCFSECSNAV